MERSQVQKVLKIIRKKGLITSRGASREGIHSQILTRLVREGTIERITRGQYREPGTQITEHHTLAVVSHAVPEGVICLLSSLSYHGIGTEIPAKVWLAIDRRSRHPSVGYPPLRIVKFSGKAFTESALPVPAPAVPEQRAIAAFLDRETTRIDSLVAKVREAIDHLKELRTALISAAVTGKIDVREGVAV